MALEEAKPVNFSMSKELAEVKSVKFASWVIVPSVQEMAKTPITQLPSQYIRPDRDSPATPEVPEFASVPVIDFQKLGLDDSEMERLDLACKDWGFFQVTNHGIEASLLEKFKLEVENFFKLPYEEKQKLWQKPDNKEGFGQHFVPTEDSKRDWSDMFFITTLPQAMRSDIFQRLPPTLREALDAYCLAIRKLALALLGHMGRALKMDEKEVLELFEDGIHSMRMNYYPPCPEPERAIGFSAHSDATVLTLLLQLTEIVGLQIMKDGKWLPVKPIPNAFLANVGDVMEMITNGIYQSIEHRVVVNSEKERISVAAFLNCKFKTELGPSKSLISPNNPPIYKTVPLVTYFKTFFARQLEGKSYLDAFKIQQ